MASWVTVSPMNLTKYLNGYGGTPGAGIAISGIGGSGQGDCDEFDGSSWAAGGALNNTALYYNQGSCGTLAATLTAGGFDGANENDTEEYNGTTWSIGGDLSTARRGATCSGTQTACAHAGGVGAGTSNVTEEYDGAAWASGGNLVAARTYSAGFGTLSAAVNSGGSTGGNASNSTYKYNGTTWSSSGNNSNSRQWHCGFGVSSDGSVVSGSFSVSSGPATNTREDFNGSTWSAGDVCTTARWQHAGDGSSASTSGIICGGNVGITSAEIYTSATIVLPSSVTSAGSIPAPTIDTPTSVFPASVTGVWTANTPTITIPALITPNSVVFIGSVPDVTVGLALVTPSAVAMAFTANDPTVNLPAIITVNPVSGTFSILVPDVVEPAIILGVNNFPQSDTVEYQITDSVGDIVQAWTNTGVQETQGPTKSAYYVATNLLTTTFQGIIYWRTSDLVFEASEILNLADAGVQELLARLTVERANNLDFLDRLVSLGLPTSSYTAPDNTGITAIQAVTDTINWTDIGRLLGLSLENHVEDSVTRDTRGNKTSSVMWVYDTKANAQTHDGLTGLTAKYTVTAAYDGNGRMTGLTSVLEP